MSEFIPLSVPNFCGNERKYVDEALEGAWVSTSGAKVGEMEECIAKYVGMPQAVCCASGSAALHLAALTAGVKPGDEVIVPALTFIASVNPTTRYVGAQPVFFGCDETATMDPDAVEDFCANQCELKADGLYNKRTGARVSALVLVHVFGNMADMPRFLRIAKDYKLTLIEDAAEALGTKYTEGPLAGKFAGTMGDVGAYSFNGNKIITTGTGGTLVSNHPEWTERAKHLSTQAKTDLLQFKHDEVGYNYRMTNIDACLGLAQMELLEGFIEHKTARYEQYKAALDGVTAVIFASSLGIGVMLSAVPVLIYQGAIALLGNAVAPLLSDAVITEMSAVGGLLIMGIGVNMLLEKDIKVANLLPAIVVPFLYFPLYNLIMR